MMFMMPMPPTSREMEAIATITIVEQVLGALLLGEKLGGNDDAEIVRAVMGGIEDRP